MRGRALHPYALMSENHHPSLSFRSASTAASSSSYSSTSSDWTWDDLPPHYMLPTKASVSRCRSPSPYRRFADLDLSDTIDPRPPFVVRKVRVPVHVCLKCLGSGQRCGRRLAVDDKESR